MESQLINLNSNNNKRKTKNKLFFIGGDQNSTFSFGVSDIEMIAMDSLTSYTSLKDILRSNSPPPVAVDSPTKFKRIDSWKEIPIKDPLLQHAAWAYLQPMTSEPDPNDGRCCFSKFKDCFCGFFTRR